MGSPQHALGRDSPQDGDHHRECGLVDIEEIAGGPDESIFQPEWAPDGSIVFASDRSGWWNLHRFDGGVTSPILAMEADFGVPAWIFGLTTFGFLSEGRILAAFWEGGVNHLGVIDRDGNLSTSTQPPDRSRFPGH